MITFCARFGPTFLALIVCGTSASAADRDATYLSGLRRLQLFDLAQRYCRQELALQGNSSEREAALTIELIRSFALDAMSRPSDQREPFWQQAREVAADFQRTRASHPRVLLVNVQDALTLLAQGELSQQEAEAANAGPQALAAAAQVLRAAAKALDGVSDALDKEILLRRNKTPIGEELSADELLRLQLNVKLNLAKAHRAQALYYPADSRDRKALLIATLEALTTAVSRLDVEDDLAARMRVLQMACHRELGQLDDAHRLFALLDRDDVPAEFRRAGLAEEARLFVAAKRPKDALALLDDPKRIALTAVNDPELDLARLEVALAAANMGSEKDGTQWQKTAAALAQRIDQLHGRAAGRRADQLVAALLPQDATGGNIELLARVADNLYIKRQIAEALAAYDKAAAAANAAGNAKSEFELRYKAGLVEQQEKNFASAAARFERLAIDLKNHPQSSEAHLVACWNKAQQARGDESAATAYVALLDEHLSRWPQATTADQARLWLGQWHEAHQKWSDAFAAYSAVSHTAKELPAAQSGAERCAREELASAKEPAEVIVDVLPYFERLAKLRDAEGKQATDAAHQAALVAADLAMEYLPGGYARAEKLLQETLAASKESTSPSDDWKSQATSLLIAAIAGQSGRQTEAEKLLESLASNSGELLKLLDRLAGASKRASQRTRQDLAALELGVIDRLSGETTKFTAEQQNELQRLRAECLALLGRRDEALKSYAAMAKAQPNNGAVQAAYAELLGQAADKASREAALALWRQIAAKSPPRSERWCQAKYSIASLQAQLGDPKGAATLCRFLLETPPGLEKTGWQEKFEKLLKSIK